MNSRKECLGYAGRGRRGSPLVLTKCNKRSKAQRWGTLGLTGKRYFNIYKYMLGWRLKMRKYAHMKYRKSKHISRKVVRMKKKAPKAMKKRVTRKTYKKIRFAMKKRAALAPRKIKAAFKKYAAKNRKIYRRFKWLRSHKARHLSCHTHPYNPHFQKNG
jgi:hypothetical protein